jgi:hypothetical protein
MQHFIESLRRQTHLRRMIWFFASLVLSLCAVTTILFFSTSIVLLLGIESLPARQSIVFIVHFFTLLVPAIILARLASPQGKTAESYFLVSVAPFLLTGQVAAIICSIALVQTFIWAEVLGTYWQQRLP